MSVNKYSKHITQDDTQPAAQAMLHAIGLSDDDLRKHLSPADLQALDRLLPALLQASSAAAKSRA